MSPKVLAKKIVRKAARILNCAAQHLEGEASAEENAERLCGQWKEARGEKTPRMASGMLIGSGEEWRKPLFPECVDVIIPVYNGVEHLKRLIPSILANTSQPHRFIFIDDCSPDKEALRYIESTMAGRDDALVLKNERNLGFTGTVIKAAKHVRSSVFVLLNTDTVVPENWLERMAAPFLEDERIGSTTPFSNSAVYFSYPNFGADHKVEDEGKFLAPDALFRRMKDRGPEVNEFVVGVGFCMGIRKSCWDKFGGFDAQAFGKGYGEECDWCMRILSHGYKNVIVPNLFVYHNHGGSFNAEEKKALGKAHGKILDERWGEYMKSIAKYADADPWGLYRLAVFNEGIRPPIDALFVGIYSEVGGSCIFRNRQTRKMQEEGKSVVSILYGYDNPTSWYISFPQDDGPGAVKLNSWEEAEQWIEYLNPKEVFINDMAFCHAYNYPLHYFAGFRRSGRVDGELTCAAPILPNKPVSSVFAVDQQNFSALLVKIGTYMRLNKSHITIRLETSEGTTVAQRKIWCGNIADNSEVELVFDPVRDSKGKSFRIVLSSDDGDEDDSVGVYLDGPCAEGQESRVHVVKYFSPDSSPTRRMTFFFHDFFSCCPSLYLQDPDAKFCDFLDCCHCIKANPCSIFKCDDISIWRWIWSALFSRCTTIRFFSENSLRLASRVYSFDKGTAVVAPHEMLVKFKSAYSGPKDADHISLAFVGAWTREKGNAQICRLARILNERMPDAKIHVHGVKYAEIPPYDNLEYHGRYDIEELPALLTAEGVHAVVLASIVPETFSFVTQECMEMGIPIIAFPIGASGDRVAAYDKGYVARDLTGDALYEQVLLLQENMRNALK